MNLQPSNTIAMATWTPHVNTSSAISICFQYAKKCSEIIPNERRESDGDLQVQQSIIQNGVLLLVSYSISAADVREWYSARAI